MREEIVPSTLASRLPQFTLFIILLRVIGAAPPILNPVNFNELQEAAYAIETASSDIYNQLFWLAMACLATIPVLRDPTRFLTYFKPLSMLFLFLGFCLLSAAWATHLGISVRRSLLLIIGSYCILATVAYCPSPNAVLRVIYASFGVLLVLNLASLPFPFAFDNRGLLRGVAGDKNFLGMLAALGLFISVARRRMLGGRTARALNAACIAGWLIILPLTGAKTAIALSIVAPALALAVALGVRAFRVSLPAALVLVGLILMSALTVLTAGFGIEPQSIVALFVSDVSFTGRDVVWQFILDQWETRWFLGFGYGSFWGVGLDSPNLGASHTFIRLLTQSHNGYLDVALAVGAVGVVVLIGFFWQILGLLDKSRRLNSSLYAFSLVIVIFILLHNLTDSSLARGVAPQWIILLCVSFALTRTAETPEDQVGYPATHSLAGA